MAGNTRADDHRSVAEKLFAIADAFDGPGSGELTLTEISHRLQRTPGSTTCAPK